MTSRKPPAEDQDIIEGVAVEKQDGGKASGRGASRRRASRKAAPGDAPENTPENTPDNSTAGTRGDNPGDTTPGPGNTTPGDGGPRPVTATSRMPLILASVAVLAAGAALGLQQWRAGTVESGLRAEIDDLSARLAAAEKTLSAAADADASLREEIGWIVSGMPADLKNDLGALVARVMDLENGLSTVESSRAAPATTGNPALVLAQSGLSVASAMIADSLAGADPSRWLPVLGELQAAGLEAGDIDALRAAMSPLPPSRDRLIRDAGAMIAGLRAAADDADDGGWWSAATGRLSGFVTFRRKEDVSDQLAAAPDDAPIAAFERAVGAGRLGDAIAAGRMISADMPALAAWIAAAERRATLDDRLAGFGADMAAQAARARKAG